VVGWAGLQNFLAHYKVSRVGFTHFQPGSWWANPCEPGWFTLTCLSPPQHLLRSSISISHAQSSLASTYNYISCIRPFPIPSSQLISLPHIENTNRNQHNQNAKCIYVLRCRLATSMDRQVVHQFYGWNLYFPTPVRTLIPQNSFHSSNFTF